jgi:cyclase
MLVIVDYKMGNLHSVKQKLDRMQIESIISSDPADVLRATKLILPGVGHFGKAMKNLEELNLLEALHEAVIVKKTPILGICLGMQLMAKWSEEGNVAGLGWIDAEVVRFQFEDTLRYKVPNTGWNKISIAKESPIFEGIPDQSEFYFVHAYYMKPKNTADVLTYSSSGKRFASSVSKNNIVGCQYHPEKSHEVGMNLIKNFVTTDFFSLIENQVFVTNHNEVLPHNLRPRIIPVLLLKGNALVKSVEFKQPKYIGDPVHAVHIYNQLKADELVFMDIDATKEKRLISLDFVKNVGEEANMPFAVGGGIRSLEDIRSIISAGAEKVVINSYAVENPAFIAEAAATFGSSTLVVCIDIKKKLFGKLQTWTHAGTKASGYSPVEFAQLMEQQGAGELIIQSIEKDGQMSGYDLQLLKQISAAVSIPVIALGGAGNMMHLKQGYEQGFCNGVAGGSMFVYQGSNRGVLISYPEKEELNFTLNR